MPSASSWNGTWTINSASNGTFPFFQDGDTVTISGTESPPTFKADSNNAPSFTDVSLNNSSTELSASFTFSNTDYDLTVVFATGGQSLDGTVDEAESAKDGVGGNGPVATWTTEDGPSPDGGKAR